MDERQCLVLTRNKQNDFKNTTKDVVRIVQSRHKTIVTFKNGKDWPYNKANVLYFQQPQPLNVDNSLIRIKGNLVTQWESAIVFDNKYICLFKNGGSQEFPIADVEFIPNISKKPETKQLMDYYAYISSFLKSMPHLDYYYKKKLDAVRSDSVLNHYINGIHPTTKDLPQTIIFPFGVNPSQRHAVKMALGSSISLIQGPPGTGKTQTILNIIANLMYQNKTVAIVAGNNAATANVYEKLVKEEIDFVAAVLGNKELQESFFDKKHAVPDLALWDLPDIRIRQAKQTINVLDKRVTILLTMQNELAVIKETLNRLIVEKGYFDKYFPIEPLPPESWSFGDKWSTPNLMKLMAEIEHYSERDKLTWPIKLRWLFKYRIYKFKTLSALSSDVYKGLASEYYQRKQHELLEEKEALEAQLNNQNANTLLTKYTEESMLILRHHLASKYKNIKQIDFDSASYKKGLYPQFLERFPVILSTTSSIINNKSELELFDYLIVDEASQVDLLSGFLTMSCAKNIVVVGDQKQISHIPDKTFLETHPNVDEEFGITPEYSYSLESLLSSLSKVFKGLAPSTLLKEHYRCHPRIIDFCNQKYYDGQLIIMTQSNSEPFKVIKTSEGNHACNNSDGKSLLNHREIDVINDELLQKDLNYVQHNDIGIVTPYRAQVSAAIKKINYKNLKIDTAHKFQGREKDTIIYSAVASRANKFNDSPNLINVAVSRAKNRFLMVASHKLFGQHGTNIGDLIRHIEYQSTAQSIFSSKTVSIFDCLYKDYSPILNEFRRRVVNKSEYLSENLMATLLDEILESGRYNSFTYKHNYRLSLVINDFDQLTSEEQQFGRHLFSHIDFIFFNKMDKLPILAIEVDGYHFHALDPKQKRRDDIKDSILAKIGLPLLRLSTKGSAERERVEKALNAILIDVPESQDEQHESLF